MEVSSGNKLENSVCCFSLLPDFSFLVAGCARFRHSVSNSLSRWVDLGWASVASVSIATRCFQLRYNSNEDRVRNPEAVLTNLLSPCLSSWLNYLSLNAPRSVLPAYQMPASHHNYHLLHQLELPEVYCPYVAWLTARIEKWKLSV